MSARSLLSIVILVMTIRCPESVLGQEELEILASEECHSPYSSDVRSGLCVNSGFVMGYTEVDPTSCFYPDYVEVPDTISIIKSTYIIDERPRRLERVEPFRKDNLPNRFSGKVPFLSIPI